MEEDIASMSAGYFYPRGQLITAKGVVDINVDSPIGSIADVNTTTSKTSTPFQVGDVVTLFDTTGLGGATKGPYVVEDINSRGLITLRVNTLNVLHNVPLALGRFIRERLNRFRVGDWVRCAELPSTGFISPIAPLVIKGIELCGEFIDYIVTPQGQKDQFVFRQNDLVFWEDRRNKITWLEAFKEASASCILEPSENFIKQVEQLKKLQENESRLQNKDTVVSGGNRCTGRSVCSRRSKITVERGHLSNKEITGRR